MYVKYFKRILDVVLVLLSAVVALPIGLVVAAALWFSTGRPLLFKQERPGFHERPFHLYKFRTMSEQRGADGQLLPDEDRLTRVGRLVRSTSLDELPTLYNVLRGDMSLVGPRPLLMQYLPLYNETQRRRHEVRPGVTGWAQVNGRNAIQWAKKFELDVWYVDHIGFWLDMKIMAMTLLQVLRRQDIAAAGHATMPNFTGNEDAQ